MKNTRVFKEEERLREIKSFAQGRPDWREQSWDLNQCLSAQ